jgi:trehalose 6-phosphate phosphatase
VDGTLIEFTVTPFETRAGEKLKKLLRDVAERLDGAVALVSGRSVEYLDEIFAPLRLPSAGLHGVERRQASGMMQGINFTDSQLGNARGALAYLVQSCPGTLLEDKGRTIAIHFRMAPQFEAKLRGAVTAIVATLGANYHVQSGSMMMEIKPLGFNKGGAVKAFMQEPPFAGRTPVYVGDDLTDIDGFHVVDALGGISISVGDRVQGRYRLENPAAVREWLAQFASLVDSHR